MSLRGFEKPFAFNVHEVKPGTSAGIWSIYLSGNELPVGWEWLARGTAVYGGGSAIDVPVAISGDSFYYLPTHEINSGCAVIAYRMKKDGTGSQRRAEPSQKMPAEQWERVAAGKWDWDMLAMPRLNHGADGLPGKIEARNVEVKITDAELDRIIFDDEPISQIKDERLERAVDELISTHWRPAIFPAAKAPSEAYRLMTDPMETVYTLALAYPHLSEALQKRVKTRVAELLQKKSYPATEGEIHTAYDPAPEKMMRIVEDVKRGDIGKIYILWLWGKVSDDWRQLPRVEPPAAADSDCGNSLVSGLIGACRIAEHSKNQTELDRLLPPTRAAMRTRIKYELDHPESGVILPVGNRSMFARWHFLTPPVAKLIRTFAPGVTEHLANVYVDHHRPTWFLAWNVELLWRNEAPFSFPNMAVDVMAVKSLILQQRREQLEPFLDIPWVKGDEYHIQKLAIILSN